jgi:hypothetical protein
MDWASTKPALPVVFHRKPTLLKLMSESTMNAPRETLSVTPMATRGSPSSEGHAPEIQKSEFSPSELLPRVVLVSPTYIVRKRVQGAASQAAKPCCAARSAASAPSVDGAEAEFTR